MVRAAGISTFSKAMMDIYERMAVGWRASMSSGNPAVRQFMSGGKYAIPSSEQR
jgi:hypothetical protein